MQMRSAARRQLDKRLMPVRGLPDGALARPAAGWVRALRDALGMPAQDLAARLGVSRVAANKPEASEQVGPVATTMALEAQGLDGEQTAMLLADRVAELVNARGLWRTDRA